MRPLSLHRIDKFTQRIRRITVNTVLALGIIWLLGYTLLQMETKTILIKVVALPQHIAVSGYSESTIENMILGKFSCIYDQAPSIGQKMAISLPSDLPKYSASLPGGDYSIDSAILALKRVFHQVIEVSIGLYINDYINKDIQMIVSYPDKEPKILNTDINGIPATLNLAVNFVLSHLDPITLASYQVMSGKSSIEDFEETLSIMLTNSSEKDNRYAYRLWGIMLSRLGEYDLALEKLAIARELDDSSVSVYINKGIVLAQQEKYDKSIEMFELAKGEIVELSKMKIAELATRKNVELATEENVELVTGENTKLPRIYYNWGNTLAHMRKWNAALEKYESAMILASSQKKQLASYYIGVSFARFMLADESFSEARAALKTGAASACGNDEYYKKSHLLCSEGHDNLREAFKFCKLANYLKYNAPYMLEHWGDCLVLKNEYLKASRKYSSSLNYVRKLCQCKEPGACVHKPTIDRLDHMITECKYRCSILTDQK